MPNDLPVDHPRHASVAQFVLLEQRTLSKRKVEQLDRETDEAEGSASKRLLKAKAKVEKAKLELLGLMSKEAFARTAWRSLTIPTEHGGFAWDTAVEQYAHSDAFDPVSFSTPTGPIGSSAERVSALGGTINASGWHTWPVVNSLHPQIEMMQGILKGLAFSTIGSQRIIVVIDDSNTNLLVSALQEVGLPWYQSAHFNNAVRISDSDAVNGFFLSVLSKIGVVSSSEWISGVGDEVIEVIGTGERGFTMICAVEASSFRLPSPHYVFFASSHASHFHACYYGNHTSAGYANNLHRYEPAELEGAEDVEGDVAADDHGEEDEAEEGADGSGDEGGDELEVVAAHEDGVPQGDLTMLAGQLATHGL